MDGAEKVTHTEEMRSRSHVNVIDHCSLGSTMVLAAKSSKPASSAKLIVLGFLCGFMVASFVFHRPVEVVKTPTPLLVDTERDDGQDTPTFLELGKESGTDKVRGTLNFDACIRNPSLCSHPDALNPQCRVLAGHFYDTLYQRWLAPMAAERFQFLEIGFYNGKGFAAYQKFLPNADHHSLEISCLPEGPRNEGKWPAEWGNFAVKSPQYDHLVTSQKLHCQDASLWASLEKTYQTMRQQSPDVPLKVVVEDGSHLSKHMAITVLFWFPRLAPGGILVVEDIESQTPANDFRRYFLPQLVQDLHFCGMEEDRGQKDFCLPTLAPLLHGIHCELHICVLERNQLPAVEHDEDHTMPPSDLFPNNVCWLQNKR